MELNLPKDVLIVLIHRDKNYISPNGETILNAGDHLLIMADNKEAEEEVYRSFGLGSGKAHS